jgi:hypothetical protein
MRTTLTLDDDVAALLRQVRADRKASLKEVVNEVLRQGLLQMAASPRTERSYRTPSLQIGRCLVDSIDNVAEVLALVEGEDYK